MLYEIIRFSNQQEAFGIRVTNRSSLSQSLEVLNLPSSSPIIVLVGGADHIEETYMSRIYKANQVIAGIAEELKAIILDGGTNSGVMASIGQARVDGGYKFPLVGVAAESLVSWPGKKSSANQNDHGGAPLEPNHTHFIFVPGVSWGDESPWISKIATLIAGNNPSLTVLLNGGDISRKDVELSLEVNRSVVVFEGTGRLADELASERNIPKIIRCSTDYLDLSERLMELLKTIK